jgi:hypothetical protein
MTIRNTYLSPHYDPNILFCADVYVFFCSQSLRVTVVYRIYVSANLKTSISHANDKSGPFRKGLSEPQKAPKKSCVRQWAYRPSRTSASCVKGTFRSVSRDSHEAQPRDGVTVKACMFLEFPKVEAAMSIFSLAIGCSPVQNSKFCM